MPSHAQNFKAEEEEQRNLFFFFGGGGTSEIILINREFLVDFLPSLLLHDFSSINSTRNFNSIENN